LQGFGIFNRILIYRDAFRDTSKCSFIFILVKSFHTIITLRKKNKIADTALCAKGPFGPGKLKFSQGKIFAVNIFAM
jgi:hypothetical protein